MFVNVGARYNGSGKDIPTKKALKEELEKMPSNVLFYITSAFGDKSSVTGDKLVEGTKYSVTGPNPYTNRKWYATVQKLGKDGMKFS